MSTAISRRAFVAAGLSAAGGLVIGIRSAAAGLAAPEPWLETQPAQPEINAWILIEPDDSIVIRVAQSEMGEGILTALPMIVAEELQCDWTRVRPEFASANRNMIEGNPYRRMGTGGSGAVRRSREFLQQAGASARVRLIEAAANAWAVPSSECQARNSIVTHGPSGRSLSFGALAGAAARIKLAEEPAIKTPDRFELIGRPLPRFDTPVKVDGRARFGIDIERPGMVYAAVATCPVFGGSLQQYDETAILGRRGVIAIVPVPAGVAVVADRYWRAKEALAKLPIVWAPGAAAASDSATFRADYRQALDGATVNAQQTGDARGVIAASAQQIEAIYEVPHLAHAAMEPLNCTVEWQKDRLDVWMGTQNPDAALQLAAKTGDVKPENVHIHTCYLGGGFGRRAVNDELAQAVVVAKAVGRPVKLIWSREDDIRHDRYRPQAALRFRAGLAADGKPKALDITTAVGSITRSLGWGKAENGLENSAIEGLANLPYAVDNVSVNCILKNTHVPVMFWRSVGSSQNAFAVESFIDEIAHAGRTDPYQLRRTLLAGREDFLGVLDRLAEKGDWGKPQPAGHGRGIAIHESFGTIVGEIVEVAVSAKGEVKVERVVAVVDCGHVVNPRTVEMQIESAVIYGLTAALYGEITIREGRVEQSNFHDYAMVRMAEAPTIETHLALSGGKKWGGIGEPGTPPIAPALANAIFAATGKRIRSLPIKNAKLGV
jgi:isoquinoline 1-oxidoreductase beta subunit